MADEFLHPLTPGDGLDSALLGPTTVLSADAQGQPHSENDLPALRIGGAEVWCNHGRIHREDGPAIVRPATDFKAWMRDAELDREDGPAVEAPYGDVLEMFWVPDDPLEQLELGDMLVVRIWARRGVRGRPSKDGEPQPALEVIERESGLRTSRVRLEAFYENGVLHRIGAPAVLLTVDHEPVLQQFYAHGLRHNESGPAYVYDTERGQKAVGSVLIKPDLWRETEEYWWGGDKLDGDLGRRTVASRERQQHARAAVAAGAAALRRLGIDYAVERTKAPGEP